MNTNPTTAVTPPPPGALVPAQTPAQRLLAAFLAGRSPRTLKSYRGPEDPAAHPPAAQGPAPEAGGAQAAVNPSPAGPRG